MSIRYRLRLLGDALRSEHLDRGLAFLAATFASFTLSGLILANMGAFVRGSVLFALVVSGALGLIVARLVPRNSPTRSLGLWPGALAVALTIIFVGWGVLHSGEHVITDRDPGVYVTSAVWLASHGDLRMGFGEQLLDMPGGFTSESLGYTNIGTDGNLQPGFFQGTTVWLATSAMLFGIRSIFWFNIVVAAITAWVLFALTMRLGLQARYAILTLSLVLFNPLTLFFVRDVFAEPATMLVVAMVAYLAVAISSIKSAPWSLWALAGLLVGAISLLRLDGPVYLIGWSGAAVLLVIGSSDRRRAALHSIIGWSVAMMMTLIAWYLATQTVPGYMEAHREFAVPLVVAAATVAGLGQIVSLAVGLKLSVGLLARRLITSPVLPILLVGLVVAGALWYGFVRPVVVTSSGSPPGFIADIVTAELAGATPGAFVAGPVDPERTYFEQSGQWQIRYWGIAAIVASIGAVSLLAFRSVRYPLRLAVAVMCLLLLPPLLLYLQSPSITPDHFWAMRRFVPFTIPIVAVFASIGVMGIDYLARAAGVDQRSRRLVSGLMIVLVFATPLTRVLPLANATEYVGFVGSVRRLCDALPPRSAVVVVGVQFQAKLQAPIRSMCDVPVLGAGGETPAIDVQRALESLVVAGYNPIVLTDRADRFDSPLMARDAFQYRITEWTVTEPPRRQVTVPYAWFMYAKEIVPERSTG